MMKEDDYVLRFTIIHINFNNSNIHRKINDIQNFKIFPKFCHHCQLQIDQATVDEAHQLGVKDF
ncbi:MAG: hypothetical protein EA409_01660 [Saprospirales bacterium]|nr:MAG: hypothetical protein EA409_01660 [Saprospirales bacterium]